MEGEHVCFVAIWGHMGMQLWMRRLVTCDIHFRCRVDIMDGSIMLCGGWDSRMLVWDTMSYEMEGC
jgi:hypothetical protein